MFAFAEIKGEAGPASGKKKRAPACAFSAGIAGLIALIGGCSSRVAVGDLGGGNAKSIPGGSDVYSGGGPSLSFGGLGNYSGASSSNSPNGVTGRGNTGGESADGRVGAAGATFAGGGGGGGFPPFGTSGEAIAEGGSEACPEPDVHPVCPATLPVDGTPCDYVGENGICTWQVLTANEHEYVTAGCYAWLTSKLWWTSAPSQPYTLDQTRSSCPMTPPYCGESCKGFGGLICLYEGVQIDCSNGNLWACLQQPPHAQPPPPGPIAQCPTSEDKQVKDLSELEASNWCDEASLILGQPAYTPATRQFPAKDAAPQCVPPRSFAGCVKNLRSQPCTATLAEVTNCLTTLTLGNNNGEQQTAWYGHGCGPLLANQSCVGIIVQPFLVDEPNPALRCVARD